MVFDRLQEGLSSAFRHLKGTAVFTEANMQEGLKAVRRALLEADVNIKVANAFVKRVEQSAKGREVHKALKPSQEILRIVHEELIQLMGGDQDESRIQLKPNRPTVLMMCGLQGSGTTTCGKLALRLKDEGQRPMLVAADLQRPAAIEQLKVLGEQLDVPVYHQADSDPVTVCQEAVKAAKGKDRNIIILDTAGRLQTDDELMNELRTIDRRVAPDYCYLVVDAMTGQEAVNVADEFNKALSLDGVVLTKLDGDARGGAALSVREVTGVPIKFVGEGERLQDLQPFRPAGMASRILGMGDALSLIDDITRVVDQKEAEKAQEKMMKGKFDLNDFRSQMQQMKKMGPVTKMLEKLGMGGAGMIPDDVDPEKEMRRIGGIIDSMTPHERSNPDIITISRRRRIARGSGVEHHEVNKLIKDFEKMREMMKGMGGMGIGNRIGAIQQLMQNPELLAGKKAPKLAAATKPAVSTQKLRDKKKQERKRKQQARKRKK